MDAIILGANHHNTYVVNQSRIPVVFSTDNNYVMPTGVAILSLLESARPTTVYEIFVLINDDVTEKSKELLRKQVGCFPNHTIEFIGVGNVFEGAFEIRNISVAAYSRLLIPWLLPQYDKVIYSDVDVIFRTDLSDVYLMDMEENYVAGVIAYGFHFIRKEVQYLTKIGIDVSKYINSGILVINSKLQRDKKLKPNYFEHAKKKYIYQDQDIINIVCKDHIAFLSIAYNLTGSIFERIFSKNKEILDIFLDSDIYLSGTDLVTVIENCKRYQNCILHYAGSKPWNTFTQAWREWWNTYQCSIFYDPDREIKVSRSILLSTPSWREIVGQIKRKLFS